jgi:hypothetical protein
VRELLTAMGGSIVDAGTGGDGLAPGACFRIEVPCE